MLAYVFWHRPRDGQPLDAYEQAQVAFHRSLKRTPPVGFRGSACFRAPELPWLGGGGYEDWYVVEDYSALGVLDAAAVGRGHRTSHDRAAHAMADGAGGLFGLQEGDAATLARATVAVWISRAPGSPSGEIADLLGDGADAACVSLWRRKLVLGPAPELCLLAAEVPGGAAADRLPQGWSARVFEREVVWPV
jgi:hypothetical protein